jgi:translation initiation factor IF-3
VPLKEALRIASESGLDLLEVSATAKPPVCKVVDYSKYKFERAKKDKEVRKKQRQSQSEIKELKFRPKIEEHDYLVKLKHIRRFLLDGDKVKLVIRYRGREIVFQSNGLDLLNKILTDVDDIAVMEKKPETLGKQQIMVIAPRPGIDKIKE